MKKLSSYILFFMFISLISCKEDTVTNPTINDSDFFPAKVGSRYYYNFYYVVNPALNGGKTISIVDTTKILGTPYFVEIDSSIFEGLLSIDTTYFRKSRTGIFYFIDTTGVSEFIPDSIRNQLSIDTESRLLFFPLTLNQTWPVYQIDITFSGVPIFSIVKITAKVVDSYLLTRTFRDSSITRTVNKIKYDMDIQLSPTSPKETYTAFGYTMDGVGFIKWEGEELLLNLIRGGTLNFTGAITSSVIIEELVSHSIP